MFGKFIGRALAAPSRIVGMVPKLLDIACGERPQDGVFDEIGDAVEKQIEKTFDGEIKK